MKKRMVTLVAFLLMACLMLTGCSSENNSATTTPTTAPADYRKEGAPPTEAPITNSAGKMYEYEVGGVTLQCKTRIEDYIDGDVFRYSDLAVDLGWHLSSESYPGIVRNYLRVYENGEYTACLTFQEKYGITNLVVYYEDTGKLSQKIALEANDDAEKYYLDSNEGYKADFRVLVLATYILENLKNNPCNDIFAGILYNDGIYHVQ